MSLIVTAVHRTPTQANVSSRQVLVTEQKEPNVVNRPQNPVRFQLVTKRQR